MIKKYIFKITNKIAEWNLYAKRTMRLLGIFNTCLLVYGFILREKLPDGILLKLFLFSLLAVFIYVVIVWCGYMEKRIGMLNRESEIYHSQSPQIMEILEIVKRLGDDEKTQK